jgi:hypothetical protein
MSFVVDVEPVVDRMALQVGYETRDVDDCHATTLPFWCVDQRLDDP